MSRGLCWLQILPIFFLFAGRWRLLMVSRMQRAEAFWYQAYNSSTASSEWFHSGHFIRAHIPSTADNQGCCWMQAPCRLYQAGHFAQARRAFRCITEGRSSNTHWPGHALRHDSASASLCSRRRLRLRATAMVRRCWPPSLCSPRVAEPQRVLFRAACNRRQQHHYEPQPKGWQW